MIPTTVLRKSSALRRILCVTTDISACPTIPTYPRLYQIAEALTLDDQFDHDSLHPPCPREPHQKDPAGPSGKPRTKRPHRGQSHHARYRGPRSTNRGSTHTFPPRIPTPTRRMAERRELNGIERFLVWVLCLALYPTLGMFGIWILALLLCALVGLVIWARLGHRR